MRDMRSERLIRRRLAREEQLQSTSPATPQGEQPSSSAAATEPPLSPSCGRERGTVNQRQYDLIQRLLAPRRLAWLRRQLRGSTGLVNGTEERCFCEQPWLYHFNQNSNDPSDTFFISVHADDSVGRECVDILSELGFSLSSSLVLAPRHASWGVPRHPSGFQISLGWGRGAHSDAAHLGHMILSLTLEGTCTIGIQRAAGEEVPAGESEWIEFTQGPGSFYAIWGRSVKPSTTMHRVVCNTETPRLSVQFRFVNRPPPAPPRDTSGERSWSVGDACQAYWHGNQGDRWYPGHIARISEDRNRFEIWYDDGDKEEDVDRRWVRVAVTAEEARLMKTRLDRNERYELGARARGKAPATPPCSPPGEAGGSGDLLDMESPAAPTVPIHLTLEDLPMVARPELSLRRHFAHQMAARGVSQAWELYWLHRRNTETDWDTDPPSTSSGGSEDATCNDLGRYDRESAPGEEPPFLAPPADVDFWRHTLNPLYLRGDVTAARQVGYVFLYGSFGTVHSQLMSCLAPYVLVAPRPPHGHTAWDHPPLSTVLTDLPPCYLAFPPGSPSAPSPPLSPPAEAGGSGVPLWSGASNASFSYNPTTPSGSPSLDSNPGVLPSSLPAVELTSAPPEEPIRWDVGDPRRPLVNQPCSCGAPPRVRCTRYASRAYDSDRWLLGRYTTEVGHVSGSEREDFCSFCGTPPRHCPRAPRGVHHMSMLTSSELGLYHFCLCQCGPECVPEDTPATSNGPNSQPPPQSVDEPRPTRRQLRSPPPDVPWGKQPKRY